MRNSTLHTLLLFAILSLGWSALPGQTTVCPGTTVYLTVNSHRGSVQWEQSTDGGATWSSIPGATQDTAMVAAAHDVWYRAAIIEGTCNVIYSDTSHVVLSDLSAHAGADVTFCVSAVTIGGSPAALGGTAPYTYSWNPPTGLSNPAIGNPTASPAVPTNYILSVTDANGCVAMDTVVVDTGAGSTGTDSVVFVYTGAQSFWVVPPCVSIIALRAWGAQGENALVGGATGGLGGFATGTLAVTPGETLWVYVGGQAGYNGGGVGGINGNSTGGGQPIGTYGGHGGGASDVRRAGTALANRVIVGGGGGGAGHNGVWPGCQTAGPGGNGGAGGASAGIAGGAGVGTPCNCAGGGGAGGAGGTQSAGGLHGAYAGNTACLRSSWGPGADGQLGIGGTGSIQYHNGTGGGGGGGGGYYGGGSGGNGSDTTPGGGGGGGSNYVTGLGSFLSLSGVRSGDGRVVIRY